MSSQKTIYLITVNGCSACQNLKDNKSATRDLEETSKESGYGFVHINLDRFKDKDRVLSDVYRWPSQTVQTVSWYPCYFKRIGSNWTRFGVVKNDQIQPPQTLDHVKRWIKGN